MKYVYYCERCRTTFEADVEEGTPVPPELVCPRCEYPHALKAFAASTMSSGCGCGPATGVRSVGGG